MQTDTLISDVDDLAASFARRLEYECERMLRYRDRFVLALSGGSVAARFVPHLAAAAVDWTRVDVIWLDERAVPADDERSNFGLARRAGLGALPIEPARLHRLAADDGDDLEAAAARAEKEMRLALGVPPRIDLALAGVGGDGHVASLFPGSHALEEWTRWVVPVTDAPKPPPRRLTVTLPVFAVVDLLVIAAFGAEKAAAVRAAVELPGSELPIARAARLATRRLVLVDAAAAAKLAR